MVTKVIFSIGKVLNCWTFCDYLSVRNWLDPPKKQPLASLLIMLFCRNYILWGIPDGGPGSAADSLVKWESTTFGE